MNTFQKDQPQIKTLTVNEVETSKSKEPEIALEDEFKDFHLNLPVLEGDSKSFDTLSDLGSCVNLIPLYLFKTLKIGLLEETENFLGLADGTKSYPVEIVKNVEIAVGEGITRSIFGVKEIGLGARPPYYLEKDFIDNHVPGEWEIVRDDELNPFKDVLVFRKMVKFLEAILINFKENMWELEDMIEKKIDWNKPPKEGDGAWHIRIEMIDPDGEKFERVFQSIPTARKLSEK
ncbi:hypothetical protein Tco_1372085 [Tanacetum coccineum]